MWLLYLLIIWLIPIVLCFLLAYIDMNKGESIKEYFDIYEDIDALFLLAFPLVNIPFVLIFTFRVIYNKIKNFRK